METLKSVCFLMPLKTIDPDLLNRLGFPTTCTVQESEIFHSSKIFRVLPIQSQGNYATQYFFKPQYLYQAFSEPCLLHVIILTWNVPLSFLFERGLPSKCLTQASVLLISYFAWSWTKAISYCCNMIHLSQPAYKTVIHSFIYEIIYLGPFRCQVQCLESGH